MSNERGVGRPTEYKQEYCEFARELLRSGAAKMEIAYELGVNRKTVERWIEQFPEFRDAIENGLEGAESWWNKTGRVNLDNKNFNSRLYELNMMNRFGWKRKNEQEHDVTVRQEDALKELE